MQGKPSLKEPALFGLVAGTTTTLTLAGENLAPTGVTVKPPLTARLVSSKATESVVEVAVPASCPREVVELTLVHPKDSPSVKLPVLEPATSDVPVKKPLQRFDQAMPLDPKPSVAVQTTLDNDQPHLYQIVLTAGARLEAVVTGARSPLSDCDPMVRVRDARRLTRAMATGGAKRDRRLVFRAPADGTYFLEISDAQQRGGGRMLYRLVLKRLPL